jgi:hypothetical protein
MYNVSKKNDLFHKRVIEITRDDNGSFNTPFQAINNAILTKRLWLAEGKFKIRFLIDQQLLAANELNKWANDEYKSLSKCKECGKILNGEVYTHRFCNKDFFCSEVCSDKNYFYETNRIEEDDYDCY